MKVKEIMEMIGRYEPEEELIILWWDRPQFDNLDGLQLTDAHWSQICKEFDEWDSAGADINQWVLDSALEYAEALEEDD